MASVYHYRESGLENVRLENGFVIHDTEYGKAVAIDDVEGLHRLIGRTLLKKSKWSSAELKFVRKEMGMSIKMLAELIGTGDQTVSLWERGKRMPETASRLLRALYSQRVLGNTSVKAPLGRLQEIDQANPHKLTLRKVDRGTWREAASQT